MEHGVEVGRAGMLMRRLKHILYVDMSDKSIPWNIRVFKAHKPDVERAIGLEKRQIEHRTMELQRMEMELKHDELDLRSDELDFKHQQLDGRKCTSLISNTDFGLLSEEINRTVHLLDKLNSIRFNTETGFVTLDSLDSNQQDVENTIQSKTANE